MKEITRIHIAKVAYDIEIDAKKDIEKYTELLARYASDPDIMDDIEIRITELLAERGVKADGVIDGDDVAAVRAQLGEPSDFATAEAEAGVSSEAEMSDQSRRVYRDEDEAVAGGVLAGFAKFFGVDPLWVRLVFIVFLFASFGTGLVIYFILWLIIPPAETAAEKLRMSGRPVTLASIKELVRREDHTGEKSQTMRRFLSSAAGVVLVLVAISGLIATIAVITGTQFGFGNDYSPVAGWQLNESWWFTAMMGLFIISGLLFSALCFVLASAAFSKRWTKRIGTVTVAIIASGLVVFTGGVAVGMYGYFDDQARLAELRQTSYVNLPAHFTTVKTLQVVGDDRGRSIGYIEYIASDQPRYQLESLPGIKPHFEIADDGLSATVQLVGASDEVSRPWDYRVTPVLTIYGPALDSIEVDNNGERVRYYNDRSQGSIAATIRDGSSLGISGTYEKVSIINEAGARTELDDAAITELTVDSRGGVVTAGVVRELLVDQADVCSASELGVYDNYVRVQAISGDKLIYNDEEKPAATTSGSCGRVIIGSEYDTEEMY